MFCIAYGVKDKFQYRNWYRVVSLFVSVTFLSSLVSPVFAATYYDDKQFVATSGEYKKTFQKVHPNKKYFKQADPSKKRVLLPNSHVNTMSYNKDVVNKGFAEEGFFQNTKYQPYLEIGGAKYFNQNANVSGVYNLFIPLLQTDNKLLFTDLRIFDRSGKSTEGNLHIGYRKLFADNKMFGIYGAYDYKRSGYGNSFNQIMLGAELWQDRWFIGANLYKPLGSEEKPYSGTNEHKTPFSRTIVTTERYEKALYGTDAQIGFAYTDNLTLYVGGYYFGSKDADSILGPKANITYDYRTRTGRILGVLDGISVELGAQHDKPRGFSGYIGIKLKVGLNDIKGNSNLFGFKRHMVELVKRDPDIVIEKIEHNVRQNVTVETTYEADEKIAEYVTKLRNSKRTDLSDWKEEDLAGYRAWLTNKLGLAEDVSYVDLMRLVKEGNGVYYAERSTYYKDLKRIKIAEERLNIRFDDKLKQESDISKWSVEERDLYRDVHVTLLDLPEDISLSEIKRERREFAKRFHPDKCKTKCFETEDGRLFAEKYSWYDGLEKVAGANKTRIKDSEETFSFTADPYHSKARNQTVESLYKTQTSMDDLSAIVRSDYQYSGTDVARLLMYRSLEYNNNANGAGVMPVTVVYPVSKNDLLSVYRSNEQFLKTWLEEQTEEFEFKKQNVILPIYLDDDKHWVSVLFEMGENFTLRAVYFDSATDRALMKASAGWLEKMLRDSYAGKLDFIYGDGLQQAEGSVGCGAYAVENSVRNLNSTGVHSYLYPSEEDIRNSHHDLLNRYYYQNTTVLPNVELSFLLPSAGVGFARAGGGRIRGGKRLRRGKTSTERGDEFEIGEVEKSKKSPFANRKSRSVTSQLEHTKLLIHSNNTDGSISFVDSSESSHVITRLGDVHHKEGISKFGRSSIYFDGNGDFLEIPDSEDWDFGERAFTIDMWIYPQSNARAQIMHKHTYSSKSGFLIVFYNNNLYYYVCSLGGSGGASWDVADNESWGTTFALDEWAHIALVRNGDNILMFKNGNLSKTISYAGLLDNNSVEPLTIGALRNIEHTDTFEEYYGYLDEVRVSKGVAKWIADFIPPVEPYPDAENNAPVAVNLIQNQTVGHNGTVLEMSILYDTFQDPDGDLLTLDVKQADNSDLPGWLSVAEKGLLLNVTGELDTGYALGINVVGDYLYLADYTSGFKVIDISNLYEPRLVRSLTMGKPYGLTVRGEYAYVADRDYGLRIVNISIPENATIVGSYCCASPIPLRVPVKEVYAYLTDLGSKFKIININNPEDPVLVGELSVPSARGISVIGNYAYVVSHGGDSRLSIINITDPAVPSLVSALDNLGGLCNEVRIVGNYAYITTEGAGSGLKIVDISDLYFPYLVGELDTGNPIGVEVVGAYAYLGDTLAGAKIIDVSDPANPFLYASLSTNDAVDFVVRGDYGYLSDVTGGIKIIKGVGPGLLLNAVPTVADVGRLDLKVTATDGNKEASTEFHIVVKNELPIISATSKVGTEDISITFSESDFTSHFSDADGDSLTKIQIAGLPNLGGLLKFLGSNVTLDQEISAGNISSLLFEPFANWYGTTRFWWKGNDGAAYSANATNVDITLTPQNDLPIVSSLSKIGTEDTVVTFNATDFTSHFSDIDGDSLSKIKVTSLPSLGGMLKFLGSNVTLDQEISAGNISSLLFEPFANWYGTTRFWWKGNDGAAYSANATNVDITLTPQNDLPIVSSLSKIGTEDTVVTFNATDFTSHFSDVEDDGLTKIQVTDLPSQGGTLKLSEVPVTLDQEIVTGNLSSLIFDPFANWHGTTSFWWKGHDGIAYSANSTSVDITLVSQNDLPIVSSLSKFGTEDIVVTFNATDFTSHFSDVDGDSLSKIKVTSLPSLGGMLKFLGFNVTLDQEIITDNLSSLIFDPVANWYGTTSFYWKGHDGAAYSANSTNVDITLSAQNDLPVVSSLSKFGTEDAVVTFNATDFTSHFSDIDGDSLSKIKVTSLPSLGGMLKFLGFNVTLDQEIITDNLSSLIFDPFANWYGTTSFYWKGHDGAAYSANSTNVDITLVSQNDLPIVSSISKFGTEDTVVTFNATDFTSHFSDEDGDSLTKIQIVSLPASGTLKLSGVEVTLYQEITVSNLGNLIFEPNPNWYGTTSFDWKGFDGTAYSTDSTNVDITITGQSDLPTVSSMSKFGMEDIQIAFNAVDFTSHFNDVDGDSLTKIQVTSLPAQGGILKLSGMPIILDQEIMVGSLGGLVFEPFANWYGTTSFWWKGYGGTAYSANSTNVDITLNAQNDIPTVNSMSKFGTEDTVVIFHSVDFTSRFSDEDVDSLTKIQIISLPAYGILKLFGSTAVDLNQEIFVADLGALTFDPVNWYGMTSFNWKGHDGTTYSVNSADVNIIISPNREDGVGESEQQQQFCEGNWWLCYLLPSLSLVVITSAVVTLSIVMLKKRKVGNQGLQVSSMRENGFGVEVGQLTSVHSTLEMGETKSTLALGGETGSTLNLAALMDAETAQTLGGEELLTVTYIEEETVGTIDDFSSTI